MRKIMILLVFVMLIANVKAVAEGETVRLDFVYASLEGFNVSSCRLFYPDNTEMEEINASPGSKILAANSTPFEVINGQTEIAMNCTNINETDESHVVYEYQKVNFGRDKSFLAGIPIFFLVLVNIILLFGAVFVKAYTHKHTEKEVKA